MDRDLDVWFIVIAEASVVAILLQLAFLVALSFAIRHLSGKIKEIHATSGLHGAALRDLVISAREAVNSVNRVGEGLRDRPLCPLR